MAIFAYGRRAKRYDAAVANGAAAGIEHGASGIGAVVMIGWRTLILGAGATGAASVAIIAGLPSHHSEQATTTDLAAESGYELCLKNDIPFFVGVKAGCYSSSELSRFLDAQVLDRQENAVSMEMANPRDMTAPTADCKTCRTYKEMRWEGWYALSSRDQRREAFFIRACGTLDLLLNAQPAEFSYFDRGSPRESEIEALQEASPFAIVETAAADSPVAANGQGLMVERVGEYEWRMTAQGQTVLIQELANADFDHDDIEEILAFSIVTASDGTAAVPVIGLMEKDAESTRLGFTPVDFSKRN